MSIKRSPVRDDLDAVVDFFPPEGMPEIIYGIAKRTYAIVGGRCERAPVQALAHDIRDPASGPRWAPGSDFWPTKFRTDVAVRGAAQRADGRPTRSLLVRAVVGDRARSIRVFGDRRVEWLAPGELRFADPEPFTAMPMTWDQAYGGWDPRVPVPPATTIGELARLEGDHPGVYPRNPYGRGYVVVDEPCEGIVLPNLEDPLRPLTPETLVVGDPRAWHRQPLPACFEFTAANFFHRLCWLGAEAWHHPPAGTRLEEVALGLLPPDFEALAGRVWDDPEVMQEGAYGMTFDPLGAGTPIAVEGMSPGIDRLEFALPEPPRIELLLDGAVHSVRPQLTNVLVEPGERRVSLTHVVRMACGRRFVPGIHAGIPLALRVDGARIDYLCPPTLRERRLAGG